MSSCLSSFSLSLSPPPSLSLPLSLPLSLCLSLLFLASNCLLQSNGFEQLCINYANEKLQQHFLSAVIKAEEAEYAAEGVSWNHVAFSDNESCLELLDKVSARARLYSCVNVVLFHCRCWVTCTNAPLLFPIHTLLGCLFFGSVLFLLTLLPASPWPSMPPGRRVSLPYWLRCLSPGEDVGEA